MLFSTLFTDTERTHVCAAIKFQAVYFIIQEEDGKNAIVDIKLI